MITFKQCLLLTSLFCVPVYLYGGDPDKKFVDLLGKLSVDERQICIGIAQEEISIIETKIATCNANLDTINKQLTETDAFLNSEEQKLQKRVDNEEIHWQTLNNQMSHIYTSCYQPLKGEEKALKKERLLLEEKLQDVEKKLTILTNSNQ